MTTATCHPQTVDDDVWHCLFGTLVALSSSYLSVLCQWYSQVLRLLDRPDGSPPQVFQGCSQVLSVQMAIPGPPPGPPPDGNSRTPPALRFPSTRTWKSTPQSRCNGDQCCKHSSRGGVRSLRSATGCCKHSCNVVQVDHGLRLRVDMLEPSEHDLKTSRRRCKTKQPSTIKIP